MHAKLISDMTDSMFWSTFITWILMQGNSQLVDRKDKISNKFQFESLVLAIILICKISFQSMKIFFTLSLIVFR